MSTILTFCLKKRFIVDSTDAVVSKVEVDPYAIGYTSLGSVTDAVKAIDVDGVAASIENVKNGSYGIARPFMLATNGEAAGLAGDFIAYVLSADGQQVVNDNGYIEAADDGAAYTSAGPYRHADAFRLHFRGKGH